MGEHADDTMNWDLDIGDFYDGDGGPNDQELDRYLHRGTLRAAPEQVKLGMNFQHEILVLLGNSWIETRVLLLKKKFWGRSESQLSDREFSELNHLESIHGDLTNMMNMEAMECQTGVSGPDVSWEHSKRHHSEAKWQCFGFRDGIRLVVLTSSIRQYLDRWNVLPNESRRERGRPYYSFSESFLRSIGAVDFCKWRLDNGEGNSREHFDMG